MLTELGIKEHLEQINQFDDVAIYFVTLFDDLNSLVQHAFATMRKDKVEATLIFAESNERESPRTEAVLRAAKRLNKLVNTEDDSHEVHVIFKTTDEFVKLRDYAQEKDKEIQRRHAKGDMMNTNPLTRLLVKRAQKSYKKMFCNFIEEVLNTRGPQTVLEIRQALFDWTGIRVKEVTVEQYLDEMADADRIRKSMFNYYPKHNPRQSLAEYFDERFDQAFGEEESE